MDRPKLKIEEQIDHMKECGIKFTIEDEEAASKFLHESTYYFKVKAYAKNYSKYNFGENRGKYVDLEFAYLHELSIIDTLLRKEIIKMSLDIEHFLKVNMLVDCSENSNHDGYSIINDLFRFNPDLKKTIVQKSAASTCNDLVNKYMDNFAIWNIVEVMSFGEFIELYALYYDTSTDWIYNTLFPIKKLRNAAAHNNCLINNLKTNISGGVTPNKRIYNEVCKIKDMPKRSVEKRMTHPIVHDFVVLLYVFASVVNSDKTKRYTLNELKNLFDVRMTKHKEYFTNNSLLISTYRFTKLILDKLYTDSI